MPSPFLARTTFRPIMLMSPLTMDRRPPWFPTVSKSVVHGDSSCSGPKVVAEEEAREAWAQR